MAKSFTEAFEAWKADKAYDIGPDIGTENYDTLEACPTQVIAHQHHGTKNPAQAIKHSR
jgi:hypothetical protein